MMAEKKRLIIDVSDKFHGDVKMIALKQRKTIKQIVIEALVNYINEQREKNEHSKI